MTADTIYALSSAPGRAGVAVLRVSGPAAAAVLDLMAAPCPPSRQAAFRSLRHPETGARLDKVVVLFFAKPASETGEDVAEIHTHGGRAVVRAVLEALGCVPGCRIAEPGEFARRAFQNGKLDLTKAEGLADLVDAETEAQRQQALKQASGSLSQIYEGWRSRLIEATALVEAAIDFSDEADVAGDAVKLARDRVGMLADEISKHLQDGRRGEILREGFRVVLAGPPNAGKSSLMNAIAKRDVAIVSEEAGTTRDAIEVHLDLGGLPVIVADTAGIRETSGSVEREGIRRTLARAREADLVIWLMDAERPEVRLPPELQDGADKTLLVLNKIDLAPGDRATTMPDDIVAISVRTGEGLAQLTERLAAIASERIGTREAPAITQVRHRQLVEVCHAALTDFLSQPAGDVELRAEDLRRAAQALGRITGRVDVEDVLDQIFGRFCIGK
jgi:tRNA modification GTPase